jgi:broad specificity phosphatase PhoE
LKSRFSILQGDTDESTLTAAGEEQSQMVRDSLVEIPFDRYLSSNKVLKRPQSTHLETLKITFHIAIPIHAIVLQGKRRV